MKSKALEFLKEQKRRHQNMADSMKVIYFDDELYEAIKELEDLENKTCKTCRFSFNTIFGLKCNNENCSFYETYIDIDDDCCNKWESK